MLRRTLQTRRRVLAGLSLGAAGLVRLTPALAAEERLETTAVRLAKTGSICSAPQHIVTGLLHAEGFADVRHVPLARGVNIPDAIAQGGIDFGLNYAPVQIVGIDRGVAMKVLAGVHVGCFEIFVNGGLRAVADLVGKTVAVPGAGSPQHLFLSVIVSYVGIDPKTQLNWVTSGPVRPKELFIDGKVDAFLGFPPEPQELRDRRIGHVVLNSSVERPWSQYFCCMLAGSSDYVTRYPVAAKRVVRAILKGADICASDPARAARLLVDGGFTPRYDYALQTLDELPYDKWREFDAEDTMRFYALRLRELGMVTSTPNEIIAKGTDWRFVDAVKEELKA